MVPFQVNHSFSEVRKIISNCGFPVDNLDIEQKEINLYLDDHIFWQFDIKENAPTVIGVAATLWQHRSLDYGGIKLLDQAYFIINHPMVSYEAQEVNHSTFNSIFNI